MFEGWESFYTLMGTAAATLVGLTFIAMTLGGQLSDHNRARHVPLFVTPTVVHFGIVLMISAVVLIPGMSPAWAGALLGAVGGVCTLYMVWLGVQFWRSTLDAVERFTWVWHAAVPGALYLALGLSAAAYGIGCFFPGYVFAGIVVLLMLVALRDAWATVEWIAERAGPGPQK